MSSTFTPKAPAAPTPDLFVRKVGSISPAVRQLCLSKDRNESSAQLAEIISTDPTLMMRVLAVANSPFYGVRGKVTSIRQACFVLGTDGVFEIAMGAFAANFSKVMGSDAYTTEVWQGAVASAVTVKLCGEACDFDDSEMLFAAALLSGLGRIALFYFDRSGYEALNQTAFDSRTQRLDAESARYGLNSDNLGQDIASYMGIPDSLSRMIGRQFSSEMVQTKVESLIRVGDGLVTLLGVQGADPWITVSDVLEAAAALDLADHSLLELGHVLPGRIRQFSESVGITLALKPQADFGSIVSLEVEDVNLSYALSLALAVQGVGLDVEPLSGVVSAGTTATMDVVLEDYLAYSGSRKYQLSQAANWTRDWLAHRVSAGGLSDGS